MTEPPAWSTAVGTLEGMQLAAEAYSLLVAAERAGLLELLAPGTTGAQVSDSLGVRLGRVTAVLEVLRAHGVAVVGDGDTWRLAPGWAELLRGEAPFALDAVLGAGRVRAEQLATALGSADDYWALPAEDRLLAARGMSFDPSTPAGVETCRSAIASVPGLAERLEAGGAVLELGCGVASRLTGVLLAFPAARAVGVELDEGLVTWSRARAEQLGVGDRLELVVSDATEYEPEELFDQVGWSQFFFPEESRVGALATARLALRPGGWVSMPVVLDGSPLDVGSREDKDIAGMRLALDLWRIPLKTTHDVVGEVEGAGFVDVHVVEAPDIFYVRGRQP